MHAILRAGKNGKIKASTKTGVEKHNHRTHAEGNIPANIDPSMSHLNVYYNVQGKLVDNLNARLPAKRRKDAVEGLEVILTASPEFFDAIQKNRKKLVKHPRYLKWVAATRAYVKKEYGDNVIDLSLHLDEEAAPHFHLVVIPMVLDNETRQSKLCAKNYQCREKLLKWQADYPAWMKAHGFHELNRGIPSAITGRKHVSLSDDRRATAQAAMPPPLPEKEGLFGTSYDPDYLDNVLIYAKSMYKKMLALVKTQHRAETLVKQLESQLKRFNKKDANLSAREALIEKQEHELNVTRAMIRDFAHSLGISEADIGWRLKKEMELHNPVSGVQPAQSAATTPAP